MYTKLVSAVWPQSYYETALDSTFLWPQLSILNNTAAELTGQMEPTGCHSSTAANSRIQQDPNVKYKQSR